MKTAEKEWVKPKRLSDKELRKILVSLKEKADKTPEEEGSFSLEVVCSQKDIEKT